MPADWTPEQVAQLLAFCVNDLSGPGVADAVRFFTRDLRGSYADLPDDEREWIFVDWCNSQVRVCRSGLLPDTGKRGTIVLQTYALELREITEEKK